MSDSAKKESRFIMRKKSYCFQLFSHQTRPRVITELSEPSRNIRNDPFFREVDTRNHFERARASSAPQVCDFRIKKIGVCINTARESHEGEYTRMLLIMSVDGGGC